MTKKLLVLFIVLAVTSVASAQMIDLQISSLNGEPITPVKEITIDALDQINMDIVVTDATLLTLDTVVGVNPAGAAGSLLTDAESLATLTYPNGDPVFIADPRVITPGKEIELGTGNFGGMTGITIDHILFHCEGPGDVSIYLTPGTFFAGTYDITGTPYEGAWGTVTVHQVPEPTTIALLGLGGLLLLRRRR